MSDAECVARIWVHLCTLCISSSFLPPSLPPSLLPLFLLLPSLPPSQMYTSHSGLYQNTTSRVCEECDQQCVGGCTGGTVRSPWTRDIRYFRTEMSLELPYYTIVDNTTFTLHAYASLALTFSHFIPSHTLTLSLSHPLTLSLTPSHSLTL